MSVLPDGAPDAGEMLLAAYVQHIPGSLSFLLRLALTGRWSRVRTIVCYRVPKPWEWECLPVDEACSPSFPWPEAYTAIIGGVGRLAIAAINGEGELAAIPGETAPGYLIYQDRQALAALEAGPVLELAGSDQ